MGFWDKIWTPFVEQMSRDLAAERQASADRTAYYDALLDGAEDSFAKSESPGQLETDPQNARDDWMVLTGEPDDENDPALA